MKCKNYFCRFVPSFFAAAMVLLLLICIVYPLLLLQAKSQRQDDVRLQVDQLGRYVEHSVVDIVEALIKMESLPRNCSVFVQRAFRYQHFFLPQVAEFSLFDPNGYLECSSWRTLITPYKIGRHPPSQRIFVRFPAVDSLLNESGIQIGRLARDGFENTAFIPMHSLHETMSSLAFYYQFLGLIDAETGVPVVLNGQYSLPLSLELALFPLTQKRMWEGKGDNLQRQYWYARPLQSLPQLALVVSVNTQDLYSGIYVPNWQWWIFACVLQLLLTLLFVFLRQRNSDPKRQLLLAMQQRQFFNVYQPIIDARDGSLQGVEVLMRWQHPVAGLINPAEFIPMAERSGVIVALTEQQMAHAETELAPLLALYPKLYLSFNICAQHLNSSVFINTLLQYKRHMTGLHVEITESEIMEHNNPVILSALQQLRQQNISIAIDDFGTGYSSLGYLQQLPVTTLKIDRSFVVTIGTSAVNAPVLEAIINLSQSLEIGIIAEGVETQEQADWLLRHGVWRHQGWLYAKGEQVDALVSMQWPWVKQHKN
jgi:sensor c-di-GMP phosphodiesterase-like protein